MVRVDQIKVTIRVRWPGRVLYGCGLVYMRLPLLPGKWLVAGVLSQAIAHFSEVDVTDA